MKKFGKELEFISWIKRDGSGVDIIDEEHIKIMENEKYKIHRLSLTEKTYIATGFNSFVVKLKTK